MGHSRRNALYAQLSELRAKELQDEKVKSEIEKILAEIAKGERRLLRQDISSDMMIEIGDDIIQSAIVADVNAVVINDFISQDKHALREWWHSILRKYGRASCCAFLLALPSDKAAIEYFSEFGNELHILSGEHCLVIALSDVEIKAGGFDERLWSKAINEHVSEGHSLLVSQHFGIPPTEFPCLVVFEDIRSSTHVIIPLKHLSVDGITITMRRVFHTIQQASLENENPLVALQTQKASETFGRFGKNVVLTVRSIAGKTFETALEVFVKSLAGVK